VRTFNFHHYDSLKHSMQKLDPRRRLMDKEGTEVTMLLFSAAKGDLTALRRSVISLASLS
jgi:glutaminase